MCSSHSRKSRKECSCWLKCVASGPSTAQRWAESVDESQKSPWKVFAIFFDPSSSKLCLPFLLRCYLDWYEHSLQVSMSLPLPSSLPTAPLLHNFTNTTNTTDVKDDPYDSLRFGEYWDLFGVIYSAFAFCLFVSFVYVLVKFIRIIRRYQVIEEEEKLVDMYYRFKTLNKAPATVTTDSTAPSSTRKRV